MSTAAPAAPPPAAAMLQQMIGAAIPENLLFIAADLGIADILHDAPLTPAEIAGRTGTDPDAMARVMRGLAAFGLFRPDDAGRYAVTPIGEALRSGVPGSMRAAARLQAHPVTQRAFSCLPQAMKTGERAFDLAHGMDFFAYLQAHPDFADLFNEFMGSVTAGVAPAVAEAYDFDRVRTIVDVGGGNGSLLRPLLSANPRATGTIFDVEFVRDQANDRIAADGLADRCTFAEGSFFESSPPAGADVYFLKSVIHDWDDESCVTILKNVAAAMTPESRMVLVEGIMSPESPAFDTVMGDLIMLAMSSGRERTEAQHAALLIQSRLRITRTIPTAAGSTLIEARLA